MARSGLHRLPLSCNSVRYIRNTFTPICTRPGRGAFGYTSNRGGSSFCGYRSSGGMSNGHLSRDNSRACTQSEAARINHFVIICCLAGWARGAEAQICHKYMQAIKTLAQRKRKDRINFRIRHKHRERGPLSIIRYKKWVPSLSNSSRDERLVYLSVQRALLPMYCSTLRMGAITPLVYSIYDLLHPANPQFWLPSARLLRRLPSGTKLICAGLLDIRLHCSKKLYRQPHDLARPNTVPYQGRVERGAGCRASRVVVDSVQMRFYVTPRKVDKVRRLASQLLKEVRHGRRRVSKRKLIHFCGVCVSLSLALPWARFYTRSLYWNMSSKRPVDPRGRCRLSHQSVRDLVFWQTMARKELTGRAMRPERPNVAIHTYAADVGYRGTLNVEDLRAGVPGKGNRKGSGAGATAPPASPIAS